MLHLRRGTLHHCNCCGTLQAVSDIVRTTLGPKSMLKMLLDPMGGIVITNGECRLRWPWMATLYQQSARFVPFVAS